MSESRGDVRPPSINDDEKTTLLGFLRYLRESLVSKLDGLTDAQARTPGVESGTNLLWLLKHVNAAELNWVFWAYLGRDDHHWDPFKPVASDDTIGSLVTEYRASWKRLDAAIESSTDLDTPGARSTRPNRPAPTLRWVLVHLIEEIARHAGHADILREQIDGAVGR